MSYFEIFFLDNMHLFQHERRVLGTYYLSSSFFLFTPAVSAHSKIPTNTFFKATDTRIWEEKVHVVILVTCSYKVMYAVKFIMQTTRNFEHLQANKIIALTRSRIWLLRWLTTVLLEVALS